MNEVIFLENDTVIVKVEKLKQILNETVRFQFERIENKLQEFIIDQDRIVHKNEVCKILEISSSTYDNWVKKGTLKAHRIEGKPYCFMSDIKAAMKPIN